MLFKSTSVLLIALSFATLSSGCFGNNNGSGNNRGRRSDPNRQHPPGEPQPTPQEEVWLQRFKQEVARTKEHFFTARYIQNSIDPFYLDELIRPLEQFSQTISAETQDRQAVERRRAQLSSIQHRVAQYRDDFSDSWPVLSAQLERTQMIFGVTSVLPAVRTAALVLMLTGLPDVQLTSDLLTFKGLVEGRAVFDPRSQTLDIAPQARGEVVALAQQIAARAIQALRSLQGSASNTMLNIAESSRAELATLIQQIELLNPVAVSQGSDPLLKWAQLKAVYDESFAILSGVEQMGELTDSAIRVRSASERRSLLRQLSTLNAELPAKVARLKELRNLEKQLLSALKTVTEEQFNLATLLTQ